MPQSAYRSASHTQGSPKPVALSTAGERLARIICHLRDDLPPQGKALPDHATIRRWVARCYQPRLANLPWEEATFELLHHIGRDTGNGLHGSTHAEHFVHAALEDLKRVTPYSFLWKH